MIVKDPNRVFMKRISSNQLKKLLNSCRYDEILDRLANYNDAHATYFRALALDQIASFKKERGEQYKNILRQSKKNIDDGGRRFPNDIRFLFLDGLHFLHAQKPKKAFQRFSKHYKKSRDPKILVAIGNAYKAMGKYKAALRKYRQAAKQGLSRLMMAHNIVSTYKLMGRNDLAKKNARVGLKIKPKNAFERVIVEELKK